VVNTAVLLVWKAIGTDAAVAAAVEVTAAIFAEPADDLLVEAGRAIAAEEAE
jgi:hypothetical protein